LKTVQRNILALKKVQIEQAETKITLSSVSKRITEAQEKLQLFDSLLQLRHIRQVTQQKSDDDSEEHFKETINHLKSIWTTALTKYLLEKEQLETYLKHKFGIQITPEQEWCRILFGESISKKIDHPLLRSEKNLNEFLEIRHEWDACIVSDDALTGSTIPIFWSLPNESAGSEWSNYLITN